MSNIGIGEIAISWLMGFAPLMLFLVITAITIAIPTIVILIIVKKTKKK